MEDIVTTDLICISNVVTHEQIPRVINLEIGRIYRGQYNEDFNRDYHHYMHFISGNIDPKYAGRYSHYLFMTLAEWREKQIESIFEEI